MNSTELAQVRWALAALGLVRNKLIALGLPANDTAMENLAAAETTLESIEGVKSAAPATSDPTPPLIEIEYELGGRWWHMNCHDSNGKYMPSGVMREVERDNEAKRSLIRCLRCGEQGYYQFGWVGLARVPLEPEHVSGVEGKA